jgi:hypothetical protein
MAADGNTFTSTVRNWRIAFKTLFTTEEHSDAVSAGFDGPTPPGVDGGFAVHWDGRNPQFPSVTLTGSDGQIEIVGYLAIREAANALMAAEQMAAVMDQTLSERKTA